MRENKRGKRIPRLNWEEKSWPDGYVKRLYKFLPPSRRPDLTFRPLPVPSLRLSVSLGAFPSPHIFFTMSDDKSPIQPDNGDGLEKGEAVHEDVVKDPVQLVALTPEEKILEKKLVRRIDLMIMPLIIVVYLMNYIDR